jgi:uncharacterized membrane protein required for colicin V production
MSYIDLILTLIVLGFALWGFTSGFVRAVASLIGSAIALVITAKTYLGVAAWALPPLWQTFWMQAFVFVLLFFLTNRLIGLVVSLIDKTFHVIAFMPLASLVNRLIGFLFGLFEGLIVAAACVFAASATPATPAWLATEMAHSSLALWIATVLSFIVPLLPPLPAWLSAELLTPTP